MGGKHTREIHHISGPDPALLARIEEMQRSIAEKNKAIDEAVAQGRAASEEARALQRSVEELTARQQEQLRQIAEERQAFETSLAAYREANEAIQSDLDRMKTELEKLNIRDLDDVERVDKERFHKILDLCAKLPPLPLPGHNVGFFGNTSVGKSTLLNQCIGETVCAVGRGETTMVLKPYRKVDSPFTYWDIPGKNDKISYLSAEFIGMVKSLAFIGIMVEATTKEMSKIMDVITFLNMRYYIIVNKIDTAKSEAELENFKEQIRKEIADKPACGGVYFVSAENKSGDWLELMDAMTRGMK